MGSRGWLNKPDPRKQWSLRDGEKGVIEAYVTREAAIKKWNALKRENGRLRGLVQAKQQEIDLLKMRLGDIDAPLSIDLVSVDKAGSQIWRTRVRKPKRWVNGKEISS